MKFLYILIPVILLFILVIGCGGSEAGVIGVPVEVRNAEDIGAIGFELVYDKGEYLKYQNNGTINYNPDYNPECPEPRGKVLMYINLAYGEYPFVTIEQDGGTRKVYNGIVRSEEFLIELLNSVR